jgi:hypothetical protein
VQETTSAWKIDARSLPEEEGRAERIGGEIVSENVSDLLSQWLDDGQQNGELLETSDNEVVTSEESCDEIAESLLVHGLLTDIGLRDDLRESKQLRDVMDRIESESNPDEVLAKETQRTNQRRRFTILTTALSIAAAVLVMFVVLGPQKSASAAMTSLEKVLDAVAKPFDRTYRLSVVQEDAQTRPLKRSVKEPVRPVKFEDEIDGAVLHVGGIDRFVFVRQLKDGRKRVSGCDGNESWAFREDSPVHVSDQLQRYRGGLPGHKHSLGFTDMYSQLSMLRDGYEIELIPIEGDGVRTDLERLLCKHRSKKVGGPKQIEIDFDPDTGVIHRMLLSGLPRARGGPRSVEFALESQQDLGDGFYSHDAHHGPGRRIRYEEKN